MEIKFITEPDVTGKGLIVVDGRYYGLPLEVVKLFENLYTIHDQVVIYPGEKKD